MGFLEEFPKQDQVGSQNILKNFEKAKPVPIGTINKYGEQKQADGTWKYLKKQKEESVQEKVFHPRFGEGIVVREGEETVTVKFDDFGEKILVRKYANLQSVNDKTSENKKELPLIEKKEVKTSLNSSKQTQTNIKVLFQTKKGALLITDGDKVTWVMGKSQRKDGTFTDSAKKALRESSQTFSQYQKDQELRKIPVVFTKDNIVQRSEKGAIQFKGKIKYDVEGISDREVKFWIPPFKIKEEGGVISVDRPFFEEESVKIENQNSLEEFLKDSFIEYDKSYGVSVVVEDYHTEKEIGSKIFFPKALCQKTKGGNLIVPNWLVQQNLTEKVESYQYGAYQFVKLGISFAKSPRRIEGKLFL